MTIEITQAFQLEPYIRDGKFTPMGEKLFEQWEESLGDRFGDMIDSLPKDSPLLGAISYYYYEEEVPEQA